MTIETSDAAKRLEAIAAKHGLGIACEFVPLSQSRNAGPCPFNGGKPWRGLNWRVCLMRNATRISAPFDYSQGEGHCPAYKAGASRFKIKAYLNQAIGIECQGGRIAAPGWSDGPPRATAKDIAPPSLPDVLASLAMDAGAIDYPDFPSWAADLDMDSDSRSAESAYRACLETGLLLRSILGDAGLEELRDAASDY